MMEADESGQGGSKSAIIIIVAIFVVGILIMGTVVLAGVVFLWAQSFSTETGGTVEYLKINVALDSNLILANIIEYSGLEIETIGGRIDWSEYKVTIGGIEVYDQSDKNTAPLVNVNTIVTMAGETVYFSCPDMASNADPLTPGSEYEVRIVNIEKSRVSWNERRICVNGGSQVETINIKGTLDSDLISVEGTTYSCLMIEVLSGSIDWSNYRAMIDGSEVFDQSRTDTVPIENANSIIADAGSITYFSAPALTGTPALEPGAAYNIQLINIISQQVVWTSDIICKK